MMIVRPRRLRRTAAIRDMVKETRLSDSIYIPKSKTPARNKKSIFRKNLFFCSKQDEKFLFVSPKLRKRFFTRQTPCSNLHRRFLPPSPLPVNYP